MSDNSKEGLPFQPNPFQLMLMPSFEANDVPRYLFRLHSRQSGGKTTTSNIIPPASTCGKIDKMRDIFRLQPQDAAACLIAHLRWSPSHESECNLISWTCSLLFALQYGLYRHHVSEPDLSQIFLLILDTRGFPEGTFVKDMEIMEVFAGCSETGQNTLKNFLQLRKSDKGYYFGEYLTQGNLSIQGSCVQTDMQRMVDFGLFELKPELRDKSKWNQWADRVVSLRESLHASQDTPCATHSRKAISIAQGCFGDRWVVPMAAMLLALKHRKNNDPVIVDEFAAMFSSK